MTATSTARPGRRTDPTHPVVKPPRGRGRFGISLVGHRVLRNGGRRGGRRCAGADTPHLLLASGLAVVNPAGDAIGRYLTRHRNAVVFGAFTRPPNPRKEFDKHVAILDFYRDAGCIQQLTPAEGLVRAYLPRLLRTSAQHGGMLMLHCEDPAIIEAIRACVARTPAVLADGSARSTAAESNATNRPSWLMLGA